MERAEELELAPWVVLSGQWEFQEPNLKQGLSNVPRERDRSRGRERGRNHRGGVREARYRDVHVHSHSFTVFSKRFTNTSGLS